MLMLKFMLFVAQEFYCTTDIVHEDILCVKDKKFFKNLGTEPEIRNFQTDSKYCYMYKGLNTPICSDLLKNCNARKYIIEGAYDIFSLLMSSYIFNT